VFPPLKNSLNHAAVLVNVTTGPAGSENQVSSHFTVDAVSGFIRTNAVWIVPILAPRHNHRYCPRGLKYRGQPCKLATSAAGLSLGGLATLPARLKAGVGRQPGTQLDRRPFIVRPCWRGAWIPRELLAL
jgi:hypothetical protein